MASLSAQLSSSIKIHMFTGKYAREHDGVRKGCVHICVCVSVKWTMGMGEHRQTSYIPCLWGQPDLPGLLGWWWAHFTAYFCHTKVALCRELHAPGHLKTAFKGGDVGPAKKSICDQAEPWSSWCQVHAPCAAALPSGHWKEILQSWDPLLLRQQHECTTAPCSSHRTNPPRFMMHMPLPPPLHFAVAWFQTTTVTYNNSSEELENTIFFQFGYLVSDAVSPLKC